MANLRLENKLTRMLPCSTIAKCSSFCSPTSISNKSTCVYNCAENSCRLTINAFPTWRLNKSLASWIIFHKKYTQNSAGMSRLIPKEIPQSWLRPVSLVKLMAEKEHPSILLLLLFEIRLRQQLYSATRVDSVINREHEPVKRFLLGGPKDNWSQRGLFDERETGGDSVDWTGHWIKFADH